MQSGSDYVIGSERWLFGQQLIHLANQITHPNYDWQKSGLESAWVNLDRYLRSCQSNYNWGDRATAKRNLSQAYNQLESLLAMAEPGHTDKQQQEITRLRPYIEAMAMRLKQPWP